MRYCFSIVLILLFGSDVISQNGSGKMLGYSFPDSLQGTGFYTEMRVGKSNLYPNSSYVAGGFQKAGLGFTTTQKNLKKVTFDATSSQDTSLSIFSVGENVIAMGRSAQCSWTYPWLADSTYRFFLTAMPDSVWTYYSAYFFEPQKKKWKFIAAYKSSNDGKYLNSLYSSSNIFFGAGQKKDSVSFTNPWLQTEDKKWHPLAITNTIDAMPLPDTSLHPTVDLYQNYDGATQATRERVAIKTAMAKNSIGKMTYKNGLYYQILKEGTGRNVALTDTVTAFYKGSILNGGIFDQTEKEPAEFPLGRLIKGWQIGVPLCKVGGKIRLVIPSALAYSIRTRGPKIPPNSALVFDIEVLSVK